MTDFATAPPTSVGAESQTLLAEIADAPLSVLCGRNNSGKSYLLRQLLQRIGAKSYYLGPARYFNFNLLTPYNPTSKRRRQRYQQLVQHIKAASHNVDNSPLDLGQAIAELSDGERARLFAMLNTLLGSDVATDYTVPGNAMSQQYVRVDGYNLAFQSSGFRLAATLLTCLLDDQSDTFIVDEPELGLSPEVQGVIADFLYDSTKRSQFFPHLKALIVGTHSPIFIDRRQLSNNYVVTRVDTVIDLQRLKTVQEVSRLQFQLLGNRLETLHLPSAIIIGEGPCEATFFGALAARRYPARAVSIVNAGGDGRIAGIVATARNLIGDIRHSAFHDRLFAVMDARHGASVKEQLARAGVAPSNIVVWERNGIEHYYPPSILEGFFGSFTALSIDDDSVSANGKVIRKRELADYVSERVRGDDGFPSEFVEKLLRPLDELLEP
jgi:hypothetical protein